MASIKLVFGFAVIVVCFAVWSEVHGASLVNDGDMAKLQELLNSAVAQMNETFQKVVESAPKMAEDIQNKLKSIGAAKLNE